MNEQLEADKFSAELDALLAGKTPAAEGEAAKDLEFSGKLARLDLSRQSRVKAELRTALLAKAVKTPSWRVRPLYVVGGAICAALLLLPLGVQFMMSPENGAGTTQGWSGKPMGSSLFGGGASPYESGITGLGGLIGGAASQMGSGASGPTSNYRGVAAARGSRQLSGSKGLNLEMLRRRAPDDADPLGQSAEPEHDREGYASIAENAFKKAADVPLSTFSIDVDAASYANVRRILNENRLPPADAVRIEEFINYFKYAYPEPTGEHPFSIVTEVAAAPWEPKHKLVRIGLKAKSIPVKDLPPNNLVFLVDTSGSMMSADKLPLLQAGLRLLVEQLRPQDRVSIVAYAGAAGLVLPPTAGDKKDAILAALDRLQAGGSTAGGAGISLAYKTARDHFLKKGNNRVILATDGDFNVGVTSDGELTRLIEKEREDGVYLTVLGFGTGNYQDAKMEQLADKGNGNYAYIDDLMEARKVLVREMGGTLLTLAKDVKLQVEFNPAKVQAYRLIGYENRVLAAEDFNDDKKDAGELGAGHTVTALYELVPHGVKLDVPGVDPLKYQTPRAAEPVATSAELLTVKFRYKKPAGGPSLLLSRPLADEDRALASASDDFRFATAVAGFGMILRGSKYKGDWRYADAKALALGARGADEDGYRAELTRLIDRAAMLDKR